MLSEQINNLHLIYTVLGRKFFTIKKIHTKNEVMKPTANLLFSIIFVGHRQFKPDATECVVSTSGLYHQSANSLDSDQGRLNVGPDLGPKCLQRSSGGSE